MDSKIKELFSFRNFPSTVYLRNSGERNDSNFYYFSQVHESDLETGSIILKKNKKPVVLSSFLEYGMLKKYKNFKAKTHRDKEKRLAFLKKMLRGKIGLNYYSISKKDFDLFKKTFKKAKFVDVSEQLGKLREVKTEKELEKISKAVKISEKTIENLHSIFKKGMTEKQLALKLELSLRENGADSLAFQTIVASGKNSGIPHYVPQNKKIGSGLLLIDFGAKYKNYCSDLTRTFFVGKAGEREKKLYSAVFSAKEFAGKKINANVQCSVVFNETADFLWKIAGQHLKHGLGHGLGLQVHDFPQGLARDSKDLLKENMVLTIEPGVYKNFGGIRIEDDIVVQKNGIKKLSKAPSELIELK